MDKECSWSKDTSEKGGIFVRDTADFIITDDLRVMPISLMGGISLLKELRIEDASILEEKVVKVGSEETLNLLRKSLISKHVLTEVFFPNACIESSIEGFSTIKNEIKNEIDGNEIEQQIKVKIILNKKNNVVLYAEVGEDFADQLLSFLTFPFGCVIRLLGNNISLKGCISNLYLSVESLALEYFKSEACKNMLVFPKLAVYYGCTNQMLKLDEMASTKRTCSASCIKCFRDNLFKYCETSPCKHGLSEAGLIEQNPKLKKGGSDSGGGFAGDQRKFMVTDNLHISPISSISAIMKGIDSFISDIVENEVSVDNVKVLSLLRAMLVSETVLTDIFFS